MILPDRRVGLERAQLFADSPAEAALTCLLPPLEHELLLAACLREGRAALDSWSRFVGAVGDAKRFFEDDDCGLKGLLPFVERSLAANGIDAGKRFHTYSRVALVREELRTRIVGEILSDLIDALSQQNVTFTLLKGLALSATAYPQRSQRHVHAIDLLVDSQDWLRAQQLLPKLRFAPAGPGPGAAQHRDYKHWTGLALGLHTRPFFLPYFDLPAAAARHASTITIEQRPVRVLSPEDNLVHVCGHAIYSRSRINLRWACDAVCLIKSHPALDWARVVDSAAEAGTAPALFTQLRWINRRLFPIPGRWLDELQWHSRSIHEASPERFYAALLHTTQSRRAAFRAFARHRRTEWGFLRFSIFPSPRYMRWKHNVDAGWKLAMHYADRPRRFARRVVHAERPA